MAKTKTKIKGQELDSVYLLKMVFYLVLGSFWVRFSKTGQSWQLPIPLGFIVGLYFASRERFQIDRKLEYAILVMSMFIGFWLPIGLQIIL